MEPKVVLPKLSMMNMSLKLGVLIKLIIDIKFMNIQQEMALKSFNIAFTHDFEVDNLFSPF